MYSRVVVDILNMFQRLSLRYKFLNTWPGDVSVANNKQKVCTKAWNTAIFYMDYIGFNKRFQNPRFKPLFET